jgi:hypothetical protein
MVFLGGAVLANIVSDSNDLRHAHAYFTQMADKEDMWISKREMMLVRDILNAWASITINFWHT